MSAIVRLDDARRLRIDSEPWLAKRDLAAALGFSVRWVEYRVAEGMPHKVFGGRLRFQRSAVEAWLEDRERKAS